LTWAGEERLPVGLATRLLAHGVGLALGLDLLALGDDLGLPALMFGLLDFGFGNCRGVDGSPVLFGVANVVDLEIDDGDAEQIHGIGRQRLLPGDGDVAAVGCDLRDVDLAHLAFEAIDHERFKVGPVVAVVRKDAADFVLVDPEVEGHQGIELLIVDGAGVEMIFLQALDTDRVGLEAVNGGYAKVQSRARDRTGLTKARHHRALVFANREKRRHEVEQKQRPDQRQQSNHAE